MFFDFLMDLSSKTPTFDSLFEDVLPEMLSTVGVLAERSMKKVAKTSHDSSTELSCNVLFNFFMTAPSKTPTFESISYF